MLSITLSVVPALFGVPGLVISVVSELVPVVVSSERMLKVLASSFSSISERLRLSLNL